MLQRGQLVGDDYFLQKVLSQGPCGGVWRALDQKRGLLVDVHFLPEVFRTNTEAMDRFRRQFATVQSFRHPNVVTPERFAEDQANDAFWVTRFVEGPSLNEFVIHKTQEEGQFPLRLVFDLLRPVGSALDEARQRNLVHRTLSPDVIVVHPTEGCLIFDFELTGIVRESLDPTHRASEGEQSRFLAPEQIDGRGTSPYTDQYALGVIAYELLGGRHQGPDAVLLPLLDQPEHVNLTLQRAMHRDPVARFPSCREFIDALENVKPSQSTTPRDMMDSSEPPLPETLTPFEIIATVASEAKATSVTKKIHRERRFQRLFHLWNIAILVVVVLVVLYNREGLYKRITRQPIYQTMEAPAQQMDGADRRHSNGSPRQNPPRRRTTNSPKEPEFAGPQGLSFKNDKFPVEEVPDEVRFAGTSGTGKRIVFVIDVSAAMGSGKQTPMSHARKELEHSFGNLNDTQRFQVVYFNEKANTLIINDDEDQMIPVSPSTLKQAHAFLASVEGSGRGDPSSALLKAIALKPDLVFFLSEENAVQLSVNEISRIKQASGDIPIHCVEIGSGMDPGTQTPIKTLATTCQGQFQWINATLHNLGRFAQP